MKRPTPLIWSILSVTAALAFAFAAAASRASAQQDPPAAPASAPAAAPAPLDPKLPTLWIIGDSTVHNSGVMKGWGDVIGEFFDTSKINVVNRGRGGRSSRTFQTEGLWDQVLAQAKKGDFVIMQFGHNDGGPISGDNRERGSLRGTGDESKEVTLTLKPNEGKKEVVHTYGWYMRKFIDDARAKGITPIVCSPVPRVPKETVTGPATQPAGYELWAREVAEKAGAAFIDLNSIIMSHYQGMTPAQIKAKYFTDRDNTHASPAGAQLNAGSVVEGLMQLKDCPLNDYLKK